MTILYINDKKVELSEDISILLTKSRTDYLNPTAVKNSFSKTVTLPGTIDNNELFNEIWQLDRTQWTGAFNPSKRVPFKLVIDGNLVESGYIKLNNISKSNGMFFYNITLYGEIGNILYSLSYDLNEETNEITELTLGDLIYEQELAFSINKNVVLDGWNTLAGTDTTHPIYQTLNFAPAYNGKPKANKFDAKKVWVNELPEAGHTIWGSGYMKWNGTSQLGMPKSATVEGTTYKLLDIQPDQLMPGDNYGLVELPDEVTDLEIRDFRSYLLRPILRLSKIFDAIDRYIYEKRGWHLVLSDPFFSQADYNDAWVTLNMLYEIDPDVETNTQFTQSQLLSKTAAPFKYLVSFCKMYGLYLDTDAPNQTITLRTMKNFFKDKTENLVVNEGSEVTIDPLSFNKSSYTFDFRESKEAEFIKNYNEMHDVPYGSKKVNTGYQFDNSSDKYIKDNIFKNATDAIEQSPYYKFSRNYPAALYDNDGSYLGAKEVKYTLFANGQADDTESLRYTATISRGNMGMNYLAKRFDWSGLRGGVYQDDYPKVQLHNDNNEAIDGSNVIVYFGGMSTHTTVRQTPELQYSRKLAWSDAEESQYVFYNVTDDDAILKQAIGKNCWINNCQHRIGTESPSPAEVVNSIPIFTRENYTFGSTTEVFIDRWFQNYITGGSSPIKFQPVNNCLITAPLITGSLGCPYISSSNRNGSGDDPIYFYYPTPIEVGHKYLVLASVRVRSGNVNNLYTKYAGADDVPGELIDHMDIQSTYPTTQAWQWTGSIMRARTESVHSFYPFKMSAPNIQTFEMDTRYLIMYDLTKLGIENRINTVEEGMAILGISDEIPTFVGSPYHMTASHDFSIPAEIYVPSTVVKTGCDIYDLYWKDYIADLYSADTRVIEGEIYLEDIHDSFKKFYWYNNALWCLSSVTDWNPETMICKAKLLKINDKANYTNYLEITPAVIEVGHLRNITTLQFKKFGGTSAEVSWHSSADWVTDQNGNTSGTFWLEDWTDENDVLHIGIVGMDFIIDANTAKKRKATITFEWEENTYIIPVNQEGLLNIQVIVKGGNCDYNVPEYVAAGDSYDLTLIPGHHQRFVSLFRGKEDVTDQVRESGSNRIFSGTAGHEDIVFYVTVESSPVVGVDLTVNNRAGGYPFLIDTEGDYIIDATFEGENINIDFRTNPHYKVSEFIVNDVDLTSQIVNDHYIIYNVTEMQRIIVTYEYTGVWLEIIATPDEAVITMNKIN